MKIVQNSYIMAYPPAQEKIHSLKLVDYLLPQADKPQYNYYLYSPVKITC